MPSLTTIYGTGAAIGTVAAFVAAYVGHKIYPIQTGGSITSVIEDTKNLLTKGVETVKEAVTKPTTQPLNTDVEPLTPAVEEQPLPSIEVPANPEVQPSPEVVEPTVPQLG